MNLPLPLSNWLCSSITVIPLEVLKVGTSIFGTRPTRAVKKVQTLLNTIAGIEVKVCGEVVGYFVQNKDIDHK